MAVAYTYQGAGAFLPGVPARDLTDADIAALPAALATDVQTNAAFVPGQGTKVYAAA